MKKITTLLLAVCGLSFVTAAQLLTWTPAFAKDNDNISITVDATKGNMGLNNYTPVTDVYIHTGVITNLSTGPTNWKYVKFNQDFNTPNAQLQATSLGNNKWRFDITNIRAYYGVPAGETILRIALLFRTGNGSLKQANIDNGDMYIPIYDNTLGVRFTAPLMQPLYNPLPEPAVYQAGNMLPITAITNNSANIKLFFDNTEIQSVTAATTISANPVIPTAGNHTVRVDAVEGATTRSETFQISASNVAPLPAGVRPGINYEAGNTSVVLALYAPGKTKVAVLGEFPGAGWTEQPAYIMNQTPDGNYWWLRITGLTPGFEYGFQYLVDGTLKVGEPYAEKILDPSNDGAISVTTYPNPKTYPVGASGIVSILQTAAPSYTWNINSFPRPDKRNLVIYEVLLRDFVALHDWNTLRDTLTHLKTMGINAIELMPFNEFEGNESWGYNPDYFLAPDKYYGPKNTLKAFIDACHSQGIAVIMDIALNHTTGLNPLAALYWNSAASQPASNNPWLNTTAKHPYNVFNDFNHESLQTRYFTSRVIEHWLQEYKLDGFRWDLSKGFTQNAQCGGSATDEACIAQYHADRIAIWKRYYDTMQLKSSGTYCILEHFADNQEELELSDYGMMLWGNNTFNFQEASMGYTTGTNSNFEGFLHTTRGWSKPHLVAYMESHDEERLMYKNINFGNSSGSYDTKQLATALRRVELCASFFLAAPGPKMIWQFGDLGFDYSINRCTDGSINNNCRLDKKPIVWQYKQVVERKRLYDIYTSLNKLRFHPWYKDVFIANNITVAKNMSAAVKTMTLRSATDSSMIVVIGNFGVTDQTTTFTFPAAGTWYDYLLGETFTATAGSQTITLPAGAYHVYLNRNLINAVTTPVTNTPTPTNELLAGVYPNPVEPNSILSMNIPQTAKTEVFLLNNAGQKVRTLFSGNLVRGKQDILIGDKISNLPAGTWMIQVYAGSKSTVVKIVTK